MTKAANDVNRSRRMSRAIHQIAALSLKNGHFKDPRLEFVTITDVRMTGDLQHADIFWTTIDEEEEYLSAQALKRVTGKIRSAIGKQLGTRLTPTINFVHDDLEVNVEDAEDLLAKAQLADAKLQKTRQNAKYAGDENPYRESL
ncbi:MAG: 30S ribosome-binding factor RbfA [Candidatus Ancillula sp.]|jgi:ribosome-binding factor A|nr:30S ribosome-binding factor RbfA [Candidatus Ancillula sp.]